VPSTFTASSGNTITLTLPNTTSFCIDGTSSNAASIQYYIDNLIQKTGPTQGTCATRTSLLAPGVPTGLTVNPASATSFSLAWTASSNATNYTVQCASDPSFIVGNKSTTLNDPTVTAIVTGLLPITSYYCRVNATNANSTSAWSVTVGPTTTTTIVTTMAGSGIAGFADLQGTNAQFSIPSGVAVDTSGTVYVADYGNSRIRKITSSGMVSTLAGSGVAGYLDNTTGTSAQFNNPSGVAVDTSGNVYVADTYNNRIRKITSGGVVTTLAGSGVAGSLDNTTGTSAQFNTPSGVAVDTSGNVYVADTYSYRIRKITSSGVVSTLAGSGALGFADGPATSARFSFPDGVAVDTSGNVYVADKFNQCIRKVTSSGVVSTLAGSGVQGFADGPATSAQFNVPYSVAVDTSGNVYVADFDNYRIRKVTSSGVVSTLAGSGARGFADGPATSAQFNYPGGVAVDASGNVYVGDYYNHRIRKIQ
jgi:sugar lactone lactonase YvrE